jgi:sodium/hydrogen antiporter
VGSVVLHGITTAPVTRWLDRRRVLAAREVHGDEDKAPVTAV